MYTRTRVKLPRWLVKYFVVHKLLSDRWYTVHVQSIDFRVECHVNGVYSSTGRRAKALCLRHGTKSLSH